jgi:hypothetical protein
MNHMTHMNHTIPTDAATTPGQTRHTAALLAALALMAAAAPALAQTTTPAPPRPLIVVTPPGETPQDPLDTPSTGGLFEIGWMTIDGGGITYMSGADYEFGTTVGQPDTGFSSGECYEFNGGFWSIIAPPSCYANCDHSSTPPILNVADFTCFLQRYAAGDCFANCDGSTQAPILNVADFTCFLQAYAAGCP